MIKRARQMGVPNGKTLVLLGCAALVLSACEEGQGFGLPPAVGEPQVESTAAGEVIERDVEAPEVFDLTERGLWDGRPSLGGVWVAHPDVGDPERVIIRNPSNSTSVIGALFRRERENPGPSLQVSSDAAEELGILAGQPTNLQVTALRTKATPVAPERALSDEVVEDEAMEATEALAEAQPTAKPIARPDPGSDATAAAIASAAAAAIETAPDTQAAPRVAVLEESDALAPASASASRKPATAERPSASRTAASSTPAKTAKPKSGLTKPFIQIGIFSVQKNADNTAASLRGIGIVPIVKAQSSQGKKFWRVIVGPAQSSGERSVLLKKVKDLGFSDAYFVTN
ncbi:MAG: SPOR domain-containing protein [Litoreibacter sp.]|nr:SPOR domain-containing protein [Litoreibacter sp.]